jgi:hypothetical protein
MRKCRKENNSRFLNQRWDFICYCYSSSHFQCCYYCCRTKLKPTIFIRKNGLSSCYFFPTSTYQKTRHDYHYITMFLYSTPILLILSNPNNKKMNLYSISLYKTRAEMRIKSFFFRLYK